MDIVLGVADTWLLDRLYSAVLPRQDIHSGNLTDLFYGQKPVEIDLVSQHFNWQPSEHAYLSRFQRDDPVRQLVSLYLITWVFGLVIYFLFSTSSYVFFFDKDTFKHPKFLKNQIRQEISQTLVSLPVMAILTAPIFFIEVRGYSKMYIEVGDYGWTYLVFQFPLFLMFTDCGIYWIHRGLHHPLIYRRLHKPHHKWIMPTPYASHAFHPFDGFAQSVPYHVFPFIFPLHKFAYLALFTFVNIWTVMIHDGEYVADSPIINGAACHTLHHLYFNYNYGQFTTLWDRLGGSYRKPNMELFYRETKMGTKEWQKQVQEMEKVVKEVEGDDSFREYASDETKKEK